MVINQANYGGSVQTRVKLGSLFFFSLFFFSFLFFGEDGVGNGDCGVFEIVGLI